MNLLCELSKESAKSFRYPCPKKPSPNTKKLPVQPPKYTKKTPGEFSGTLWGVSVHYSRGGGGVEHFAPERGVFWYKVECFLVFNTNFALRASYSHSLQTCNQKSANN